MPMQLFNDFIFRRNYNFGMSDGDWGMGWGSKDNSEYVKVKKSQIPKIKKSDKRR